MDGNATDRLINEIRQLTGDLNDAAKRCAKFDPLYRVDFACDVMPPSGWTDATAPVRVVLNATYSSGHGEETAHLLSRSVSFSLYGGMITDIVFSDGELGRNDDIAVAGDALRGFIARLKSYFSELLPNQSE